MEKKFEHYILFRFMSYNEAIKLLQGETLHNDTDFKKNGAHTSSKGFCFMDGDKDEAEYAYNFLGGVVSDECCLILRFNQNTKLTESSGRYADPYGAFFDTINVNEVCTETYNDKMFTPIRYALNVDYDEFTWHDMVGERADVIKVLEQARDEKLEEVRKEFVEEQKRKEEAEYRGRIEHEKFMKFYEYASESDGVTDAQYTMEAEMLGFRRTFYFTFFNCEYLEIEIESRAFCNIRRDVESVIAYLLQRNLPKDKIFKIRDILFHIIGKIENEYHPLPDSQ